jgi:predicted DNA binding CopG/RHH family protein
MSKIKLEPEEQELLDAFESGKLVSVLTAERRKEIEQAAVATSKKDKRTNIRLSSRDLSAISNLGSQYSAQICLW